MPSNKKIISLLILVLTLISFSNTFLLTKKFGKISENEELPRSSQTIPFLQYNSHVIDDDYLGNSYGNGNGSPESGETIELLITLENSGFGTATGVYAYLSTTDPLINIWDNHEVYPEISNSSMGTCNDYELFIDPNHGSDDITFMLDIYSNEGHWTDSFSIKIYSSARVDDSYEDNDNYYDAYDLSDDKETYLSSINGTGIQGDDDWYYIFISYGWEWLIVDLIFTHAYGDINIQVYDNTGTQLITLSQSITDNEYIDYSLPSSGFYYLKVYGDDAGNSYDLWWDNRSTNGNGPPPESMIPGYDLLLLFAFISVISAIIIRGRMNQKTNI